MSKQLQNRIILIYVDTSLFILYMLNNIRKCQTRCLTVQSYLIYQYYSVNDIHVKQCQKSVRQLQNYFDTSIFILYMLNNVKQCQTMSEKCQTVT